MTTIPMILASPAIDSAEAVEKRPTDQPKNDSAEQAVSGQMLFLPVLVSAVTDLGQRTLTPAQCETVPPDVKMNDASTAPVRSPSNEGQLFGAAIAQLGRASFIGTAESVPFGAVPSKANVPGDSLPQVETNGGSRPAELNANKIAQVPGVLKPEIELPVSAEASEGISLQETSISLELLSRPPQFGNALRMSSSQLPVVDSFFEPSPPSGEIRTTSAPAELQHIRLNGGTPQNESARPSDEFQEFHHIIADPGEETAASVVSLRNESRATGRPSEGESFVRSLRSVSASSILGNGENLLLRHAVREGTDGVDSPKEASVPGGLRASYPQGNKGEQPVEGRLAPLRVPSTDLGREQVLPETNGDHAPEPGYADELTAIDNSAEPRVRSYQDASTLTEASQVEATAPRGEAVNSAGTLEPVDAPVDQASQATKIVSKSNEPSLAGSKQRERNPESAEVRTHESSPEQMPPSNAAKGIPALANPQEPQPGTHVLSNNQTHTVTPPGVQTGQGGAKLLLDPQAVPAFVAEHVIAKLSNGAVQSLQNGISEMRVTLKPESLGQMSLRVQLHDEGVTAQIQVAHPDVRAAMEANIPQLRDALSARGIEVQQINIVASGEGQARESRGQHEAKSRSTLKRRGSESAGEQYRGSRRLGYNTIEVIM